MRYEAQIANLPKSIPLEIRFWKYVEKTPGCWNWTGAVEAGGYGQIRAGGTKRAHRISWLLHHGKLPAELDVLHTCDNPRCVRPEHLYLGTQLENMRDRKNRGRRPDTSGERNPRAKLTADNVRAIREEFGRTAYKRGRMAIATKYGISYTMVQLIVKRRSWSSVA